MNVSESALSSLPVDEQMFTVVNEERVDRGLPPINYMTTQLNSYAQAGADGATDPSLPSALTGGSAVTFGGSLWAGALSSVLEADYYWMYSDGWGGTSGTSNEACSQANPAECWGRRDIILHEYANCPNGARRCCPWAAGLLVDRLRRWLHRRHLRQLVRARRPTSS